MVNPLANILKKGEQFIKNLTSHSDNQEDGAKTEDNNDQKWVNIAVEKVNRGELWKEWFK